MRKIPDTGIILLAAGASLRMGQSKQMMKVDGEPLLVKMVKTAIAANVKKVVVVLGAAEKQHRSLIDQFPVDIIYNKYWQKGMGSSLKTGLSYSTATTDDLKGVIVLVCDQPMLQAGHIKKIIHHHIQTKKPVVASRYAGITGVPVFFENTYFRKLMDLGDAEGAKKIILNHPQDVASIDFPQGEFDLDTPDDYRKFTAL